MNSPRVTLLLLIAASFLINISTAMYIKSALENQSTKGENLNKLINHKDEWSVFQQKLGLTNQKGNYRKLHDKFF